MSELQDKIKSLDKVEAETFTMDYNDTVEIPSQYKEVIAEHRKSLIDIKNDLVAMISYTNRKDVSDEDKYEDYEVFLDEDYDIVAYCNDIKIVLNQKFLFTDKEQ